jgi:hypothetical protein
MSDEEQWHEIQPRRRIQTGPPVALGPNIPFPNQRRTWRVQGGNIFRSVEEAWSLLVEPLSHRDPILDPAELTENESIITQYEALLSQARVAGRPAYQQQEAYSDLVLAMTDDVAAVFNAQLNDLNAARIQDRANRPLLDYPYLPTAAEAVNLRHREQQRRERRREGLESDANVRRRANAIAASQYPRGYQRRNLARRIYNRTANEYYRTRNEYFGL